MMINTETGVCTRCAGSYIVCEDCRRKYVPSNALEELLFLARLVDDRFDLRKVPKGLAPTLSTMMQVARRALEFHKASGHPPHTVRDMAGFLVAVEFGYKCAESGKNIQQTLTEAGSLL